MRKKNSLFHSFLLLYIYDAIPVQRFWENYSLLLEIYILRIRRKNSKQKQIVQPTQKERKEKKRRKKKRYSTTSVVSFF